MSRRSIVRAVLVTAAVVVCAWLVFRPHNVSDDDDETQAPRHLRVSDYLPHFGGSAGDFVPSQKQKARDTWVDLETELMWTKLEGGIEGYYTFSNMYLSGGALVSVVPSKEALAELPAGPSVLSGSDGKGGRPPPGDDLWAQIVGEELALSELGQQVVRLPGITYFFNDQPGTAGFMAYFEHYVPELFIPAARSVASSLANSGVATDDTLPTRIIFPRCGPDPSWRDDKGMNRWLLNNMLPMTVIEDSTQWNDRASGNIGYVFDHIVVVDRGAAHSARGDTARWGKMNANAPSMLAPKTFFEPFRKGMMAAVGGKFSHVGRHSLPVVVLIERDSEPRIEDSSHDAIVHKLKGLTGRAEIHITRIKGMTREEKVSLLSKTDVLIGLNGDDLLSMMWMKNGGTVIEVFEEGGFARDMEVAASLLDIHHVAVRGDRILWKEEWKEHPLGQRGPQKNGLVEVQVDVVINAVLDALNLHAGKQVLGFEG